MKRKQQTAVPKRRVQWCIPCGVDGRATPAATVVDDDPMCVGCAAMASAAEKRLAEMMTEVAEDLAHHGKMRTEATPEAEPLPLYEVEQREVLCRWSSDDFGSDVFCTVSPAGVYTIQVAAGRVQGEVPKVTAKLQDDPEAYVHQHKLQLEFLLGARYVDLLLPHAGAIFTETTRAAYEARLALLSELGFRVPADALRGAESEAA